MHIISYGWLIKGYLNNLLSVICCQKASILCREGLTLFDGIEARTTGVRRTMTGLLQQFYVEVAVWLSIDL
jgi:hypothetical protein